MIAHNEKPFEAPSIESLPVALGGFVKLCFGGGQMLLIGNLPMIRVLRSAILIIAVLTVEVFTTTFWVSAFLLVGILLPF